MATHECCIFAQYKVIPKQIYENKLLSRFPNSVTMQRLYAFQ